MGPTVTQGFKSHRSDGEYTPRLARDLRDFGWAFGDDRHHEPSPRADGAGNNRWMIGNVRTYMIS